MGNRRFTKNIYKLIDETEINAVVIDIKNEYGYLTYKSDIEYANKIRAYDNRRIERFLRLMGLRLGGSLQQGMSWLILSTKCAIDALRKKALNQRDYMNW